MALFSQLKQIKDLRHQAKSLQDMLAQETVSADAKGGKIRLVMDGNQAIQSLDIDDSLLTPERKAELTEGVREAVNDAIKKVQKVMAEKMRQSGMSLPGMGK